MPTNTEYCRSPDTFNKTQKTRICHKDFLSRDLHAFDNKKFLKLRKVNFNQNDTIDMLSKKRIKLF